MVDFRIRVVVDTGDASRKAKQFGQTLDGVNSGAERLRATLLSAFAAVGITAGLGSSIRLLADFSQSMAEVRAVSGATAEQFAELEAKAKELGQTTRFSATEASDALGLLARAGFSVEESLTAVGGTLQLAQAGGLGLASAADIATNALRGFRLAVDQTGRVVDVLAVAANASNSSVEGLGEGLKFVAPVAAGLNVSLEKTVAIMGALSDAGLQGSLAGTGLRRVLSELESPSEASQKILAKLGLTANSVKISSVGLAAAIKKLARAGIDTGQALEIFGDRGGPAFEVIASSLPKIDALEQKLKNSAGAAAETARIMNDNLKGSLFALGAAFQGLVIEVAQSGGGLSSLRGLVDSMAAGLRFLSTHAEAVGKVLSVLGAVIAGKVVASVLRFTTSMKGLNAIIGATPFARVVSLLSGLAVAVDKATDFSEEATQKFSQWAEENDKLNVSLEKTAQTLKGLNQKDLDRLNLIINAEGELQRKLTQRPKVSNPVQEPDQPGTPDFFNFDPVGMLGAALAEATKKLEESAAKMQRALDLAPVTGALARELEDVQRNVAARGQLTAVLEQEAELRKEGINLSDTERDQLQTLNENLDLEREKLAILQALDGPERERNLRQAALNELLAQGAITQEQYNKLLGEAALKAAEAGTSIGDGFGRGIEKINAKIHDLASLSEQLLTNAFDNIEDALVNFVRTGKFEFDKFVDQLLDDIARLLVRLLILQAVQAITGTGPATGGGAGNLIGGITGRASGGPVNPHEAFIVGEDGPELFQPPGFGHIVDAPHTAGMLGDMSAAASAQALPPQVNVSVVNVTDPSEVASQLDSGTHDKRILNVLGRNKSQAKQVLA